MDNQIALYYKINLKIRYKRYIYCHMLRWYLLFRWWIIMKIIKRWWLIKLSIIIAKWWYRRKTQIDLRSCKTSSSSIVRDEYGNRCHHNLSSAVLLTMVVSLPQKIFDLFYSFSDVQWHGLLFGDYSWSEKMISAWYSFWCWLFST